MSPPTVIGYVAVGSLPSSTDGMWAAIGAMVVAAFAAFRTWLRRPARPQARSEAERLDAEKWQLLEAVRVELDACRDRSDALELEIRVERWRTSLLIRALQEAGIAVPEAVLIDVTYDPATDSYQLKDRH